MIEVLHVLVHRGVHKGRGSAREKKSNIVGSHLWKQTLGSNEPASLQLHEEKALLGETLLDTN